MRYVQKGEPATRSFWSQHDPDSIFDIGAELGDDRGATKRAADQ